MMHVGQNDVAYDPFKRGGILPLRNGARFCSTPPAQFWENEKVKLGKLSHTERSDSMRIISARLLTKPERQIYEEG